MPNLFARYHPVSRVSNLLSDVDKSVLAISVLGNSIQQLGELNELTASEDEPLPIDKAYSLHLAQEVNRRRKLRSIRGSGQMVTILVLDVSGLLHSWAYFVVEIGDDANEGKSAGQRASYASPLPSDFTRRGRAIHLLGVVSY